MVPPVYIYVALCATPTNISKMVLSKHAMAFSYMNELINFKLKHYKSSESLNYGSMQLQGGKEM